MYAMDQFCNAGLVLVNKQNIRGWKTNKKSALFGHAFLVQLWRPQGKLDVRL